MSLAKAPGPIICVFRIQKILNGNCGEILVSGFIDNFKIERRNLAPIKGEEKMLSINAEIRNAINKKGGDIMTVTLYLLSSNKANYRAGCFRNLPRLRCIKVFKKLPGEERNDLI